LLKNEVKANNIYKLSTTNEHDNKAASCTYSCPLKNRWYTWTKAIINNYFKFSKLPGG